MTTKAAATNDLALVDVIEQYLIDSGGWQFVPNTPLLSWVDLRANAAGDGRAMDTGRAVLRQMAYEARGGI
jgi:hypothetical protein